VAALVLVVGSRLPGPVGARIATVAVAFVSLVAEAMPFLLAGAVLATLARGPLVGRLAAASTRYPRLTAGLAPLTGAVLPLCDCGLVPVARRLRADRGSAALVNGFVAGAPLTNPIVILSTLMAFPGQPQMVVGRIVLGVAVAIAAASLGPRPGGGRTPRGDERHTPPGEPNDDSARIGAVAGFVPSMGHELFHTGPTLILGALAAAAIRAFVPTETLLVLAKQPLIGAAAMMVLAFVMSICSQADAFVAASLPVGPLPRLAFLVLGPMLDLKLAVLYGREFGPRWVAGYAAVVVPAVLVAATAWTTWVIR
jgi:hypothetical protein